MSWRNWISRLIRKIPRFRGQVRSTLTSFAIFKSRVRYIAFLSLVGVLFVPMDTVVMVNGVLEVSGSNVSFVSEVPLRIKSLKFKDGDAVSAGEVVIDFDSEEIAAQLRFAQSSYTAANESWRRLSLESGFTTVPENLSQVIAVIEGESGGVSTRDDQILLSRISQEQSALSRTTRDLESAELQFRNAVKEHEMAVQLRGKGFVTANQLFSAENRRQDMESKVLGLRAERERLKEKIRELELTRGTSQSERKARLLESFHKAATTRAEALKSLRAAERLVSSAEAISPVSGHLLIPQPLLVGALVRAGDTVFEVVPSVATFSVRGSVDQTQGYRLRPGMDARLRLTGASASLTRFVNAKVEAISPDAIKGSERQMDSYSLRIIFDSNEFADIYGERPRPGMLCSVQVVGESQSVIGGLLNPFIQLLRSSRLH
jgi:HlyD family type I secretion membrane fusion protein